MKIKEFNIEYTESEQDHAIVVSTRWYEAKVDTLRGQITSIKDKRTKGFEKEITFEGQPLNQLVIYNDVPFFWDNWDICHHSLDSKVKKV